MPSTDARPDERRSTREVRPELLDDLPAGDPRAVRSRRDLQTVNRLMGHRTIVSRELGADAASPRTVVELGAGDGTFLLGVAKRLGRPSSPVRAVLIDRHPAMTPETRAGFDALGWRVETQARDVFDYLRQPHGEPADVTIANLFLHHFRDPELSGLLLAVARRTRRFVACEPRRSRQGLAGAWLLRLLGCSDVTLHDADASVRAGFRDAEISALWPRDAGWRLTERPRGLFSHTFVASHAHVV